MMFLVGMFFGFVGGFAWFCFLDFSITGGWSEQPDPDADPVPPSPPVASGTFVIEQD